MYRIMIIDDNYLSVEGICQNIDWPSLDAEVTHKAYDGLAALELLEQEPVDLIISDIEMPQLDGLKMAEKALTINPMVKIILISAFDKFEYAKQAVRIGAFDYIEKPLDYPSLAAIISKALEILAQEKANLDLLKRSKPAMIDNFFSELLSCSGDEAAYRLSSYQEYLNLQLDYRYFQVVIIRIENASKIKEQYGTQEYHIRLMSLSDDIRTTLKDDFHLVHILSNFTELKIILGHNYSGEKYFHKTSAELFTAISERYQETILNLNIGIGSVIRYLWDMHLSCESAAKALDYCFFFPQKNIFDIRDKLGSGLPQALFQNRYEEQLIQLICKKDLPALKAWIDKLSEELLSNYQTKQLVFIQIYSLLGRLLKFLYEMDIDSREIEKNITDTYSKIDQFVSSSEIFEWLYHICALTCEKMYSSVQTYHERTCEAVNKYIREHYHDSSLCLNNIADYVNVSPAHLSALFKKIQKENISDVITAVRIEAACQMLKNTTTSLKEISEKVGYTNQYYFSSCFKKKTGKTPSVYREERIR